MKTSININVIALLLNENTLLQLFYTDSRVSFTKGLSQVTGLTSVYKYSLLNLS